MDLDEAGTPVANMPFGRSSIPHALDQMMDAVIVADVGGRIIYWNKGAEQTLLVPREEAVGQLISNVVQMDAGPVRGCVLDETVRDRASDGATRLRRRDGTLLNTCVSHSIIRDPHGKVMGMVVIFRDMGPEEKAGERQQDREDRYSQLFNHMAQGVVYMDRDGSVFSMNASAKRILGIGAERILETVLGKIEQCIVREDGSPMPTDELPTMLALNTGQKVSNVVVGFSIPPETEFRWLNVSAVPLFRPGEGRPCQVYSIFEDITEQRDARNRVEMERARMSTILNSLPVGVGISDRDGRLIEANEMFLQTWGCGPEDDLLARMIEEGAVISPETGTGIGTEDLPLSRSVRSGGPERATFNIERPDGTLEAVAVSSAPILDGERSVAGFITVVQNINERSRMENELKRRAMMLSRSNADLQQFAYAASHDLQEPLRMIMCYIGLLEKKHGDELNDRAKEYLGFARDGAKRMRELIDDLLAYSRVETKGSPRTWVDMEELVGKVIANLQVSIGDSGASVQKEPLPPIWADEVQMGQLMQNLIGNAIKFRGEVPPLIKVRSETSPLEWKFMVEDNGIGIDRKHYGRIFQMFQRLHTREEYEGTGIGLAICKKIVERHGGNIWVESEVGQGSAFCFIIPRTNEGAP